MAAVSAKKDNIMKLFGTVKTFHEAQGYGIIKPEAEGDELRFEESAVQWGNATTPKTDRRLSYEVGKNGSGDACAINLHSE
jgi:cold shock CspA family protein